MTLSRMVKSMLHKLGRDEKVCLMAARSTVWPSFEEEESEKSKEGAIAVWQRIEYLV